MPVRVRFNRVVRLGLLLAIAILPVHGQNQTPANVAPPAPTWQRDAWRDPNTGLMWALRDNGSDVTQYQALDYCRSLSLGGFRDWRLAEIDELAGIYDPSVAQRPAGRNYDVHVKGGIQLTTGGAWSATSGNNSGEAWDFGFSNGGRDSLGVGYSFFTRALCVRRAGE